MKRLKRMAGQHRLLAASAGVGTLAAAAALAIVVVSVAMAAPSFHGITVLKSCDDPVKLTESYTCAYRVQNADPDAVRIVSYRDEITSAPANPAKASGEIMSQLS